MESSPRTCSARALLLVAGGLLGAHGVNCPSLLAQDWPQWRGPNRDAKASFKAPQTWPKQLKQQWKVTVGDGVATPALVGEKLYVFTMQDKNEVIRCLDAGSGKDVWQDKYEAQGATGAAGGFAGPRASPTVAEGKVVTLGVRGTVSCLEADSGKKLWRKDDFKAWPTFFTSSSPIVVDGLCIVQVGGQRDGGIVAYDLSTGAEKWKSTGEGTAYASPSLLTVDGLKAIVAETDKNVVAIGLTDGKSLWKTPFAVQGFGGYNAASPIVQGQTVILIGSNRGARAMKIEKEKDALAAKELWNNKDKSVQYNTPVIKDGFLYGLTQGNELFCLNMENGQATWSTPISKTSGGGGTGKAKGKGRGGRSGYGSIVDAGTVLLALTPGSELIAFQPSSKEYAELARIKVADSPTYAYPVVSGNRIFIKDQDAVTLWTLE